MFYQYHDNHFLKVIYAMWYGICNSVFGKPHIAKGSQNEQHGSESNQNCFRIAVWLKLRKLEAMEAIDYYLFNI